MILIKKILLFLLITAFIFLSAGFVLVETAKRNNYVKTDLMIAVKKIKRIIYYEATIHNPDGDMLPDEIDDTIIGRVRIFLKEI